MIDVHAHTTNHQLWGLCVTSATINDLEVLAEKFGIEKIVLMATYFPFKKSGLSNRELLERIKGKKQFAMFGGLDVMNNLKGGIQELEELVWARKIVGIKLYPGYQDFSLSDEKVFPIYQMAGKYSLPVAIHSGELHFCCPREEREKENYRCGKKCRIEELQHLSRPKEIIPVAQKFPEVNFIMAHLGNPFFEELREVMKACPNVYSDISGQFTSSTEEDTPEYRIVIRDEIKKFLALPNGTKRIMFGTDFPIQSYEDTFAILDSLDLDFETSEDVVINNARRIINL